MIKKVILFCVTFIISVGISAQVKDDFELNIRQLILPGDLDNKNSNSDCLYKLTNNKFEIFSTVWKRNSKTKENELVYKKRYTTKISIEDYQSIKMICRNMLSFDSSYTIAMLDGDHWRINYVIDGNNKKIVLDNYSLKETNEIFRIMNKYNKKKRYHLLILEPNK